jgi:cytochrome c-type biogenesis protein
MNRYYYSPIVASIRRNNNNKYLQVLLLLVVSVLLLLLVPTRITHVTSFTTSSSYNNNNNRLQQKNMNHHVSINKIPRYGNIISQPVSESKTSLKAIPELESIVTQSSSLLLSYDWDEIFYNIQGIARTMASMSLDGNNPTNLVMSLPIMYGAGLLTSASPCVWGLLPLTMSYISQAAGERADHKTTLPTLAFAAGLATVFCTLGVAAVELGGVFGSSNSSTSTAILAILSNGICLAMGLKLLDLINIRLPSFARDPLVKLSLLPNTGAGSSSSGIRSSSNNKNDLILIDATGRIMTSEVNKEEQSSKEQGSLIRTFLLGGSSALVASPCATPVLTSILAYVASAANPAIGALLLLGYTAGYSTPLLIVAATGGQALENLRNRGGDNGSFYSKIGPWVTPLTGGILLWYGTDGILHTIFGDPSVAGLTIL